MTFKDIDILCDPLSEGIIERNLAADPLFVARDKRIARLLAERFGASPGIQGIVASQIKYLQKARTKLPHFYEARCLIPPRAFEQSGSSETAAHKAYRGELCIDLTCGLGVDSANFARHFGHVVSLERDPVLAAVARINFHKLGLSNIEVIETTAEDFLARCDLHADLIYADPDRRSAVGRRLVLLEDCSPDVVALHPLMAAKADTVLIKASPLFDPDEAFRIFGPQIRVEAVSLGGECKELLIETSGHIKGSIVAASVADGETVEFPRAEEPYETVPFAPPYRYMIVPDAAVQRMRLAPRLFAPQGVFFSSAIGYGFCNELPSAGMYASFGIEELMPFDVGALSRLLRERGVHSLKIMQRDFPMTNSEIARRLKVKEGGQAAAAFCMIGGRPFAALLS